MVVDSDHVQRFASKTTAPDDLLFSVVEQIERPRDELRQRLGTPPVPKPVVVPAQASQSRDVLSKLFHMFALKLAKLRQGAVHQAHHDVGQRHELGAAQRSGDLQRE